MHIMLTLILIKFICVTCRIIMGADYKKQEIIVKTWLTSCKNSNLMNINNQIVTNIIGQGLASFDFL